MDSVMSKKREVVPSELLSKEFLKIGRAHV